MAYLEIDADPLNETGIINAGTTHIGPTYDLRAFTGVLMHIQATSIPADSTFKFQYSGRKEVPTQDNQWTTALSADFDVTSEPTIAEKNTNAGWFRYQVTAGAGGNITGFEGFTNRTGVR